MIKVGQFLFIALLTLQLAACGGGGGGGGSAEPVAPAAGAGGGAGGGSAGGGAGGGVGGGTGPGVELQGGVSGTGLSFGSIQGFSSVILNGRTINVDGASIFVEGALATLADLREGQTVSVIGDLVAAEAVDVRYRSLVRGPIESLSVVDVLTGSARGSVLGQPLRFNAVTLYDGVTLDQLSVGDVIEVSGLLDQAGSIVASYVKPETGMAMLKVVGNVDALTASTFVLRGLTVDYSGASLLGFGTDALAADELVEVRFDLAPLGSQRLDALSVERLATPTINENADLDLEGFVTSVASADSFVLSGQPVVTTGATIFEQGDASDIAVGAKLQVEGSTNASGELVAELVQFRSLQAVRAVGPVEAIDLTASTARVLGVTFAVRATSELEDDSSADLEPFALVDLAIGQSVEVRGFFDGKEVVAVELSRIDPEPEAALRAPVSIFDAAAGTLSLFDVALTTSAETEYENESEVEISRATFFSRLDAGLFIEAEWENFSDTGQPVDGLEIEGDDD